MSDADAMVPVQVPLLDLEERNDLIELAAAPAVHNGNRTMRDIELVNRMAELFALGRGCKAVARAVGISPHTCRAIRNALESSGRLAPLKRRLSARAAAIIEDGLDILHDAMLTGDLPVAQISVPLGILSDKMANWSGEAVAVVEHRVTVASPAEINQAAGRLAAAILLAPEPPIDCESIENPTNPPENVGAEAPATASATDPPPLDPAGSEPAGPIVEGGGGGAAAAGGREMSMHRPAGPNPQNDHA